MVDTVASYRSELAARHVVQAEKIMKSIRCQQSFTNSFWQTWFDDHKMVQV